MTKNKTVTMSRELAERMNNLVGDFFGSEPEFDELRAILASTVVERQYKQYTTQPAESLAGMAARQLKDEGRWIEIRDANALEFPDMAPHDYYPVGSVIRIPCASPPAPVSVVQTCKIGIYGRSYDAPETKRAYTYIDQPNNVTASKLGRAAALTRPGGDSIDHGLSLLKTLSDEGFGVFELNTPRPSHANAPADSGTHPHNDGLDSYRGCCGSCPAGCVSESKP